MDPVILASARKRGITDEQMTHAYRNPIRVLLFDDLTMLVGPDASGRLLEIGLVDADGVDFIVMPARQKFTR